MENNCNNCEYNGKNKVMCNKCLYTFSETGTYQHFVLKRTKKEWAELYFQSKPESLEMLKTNKQAWAFEHSRGIWKLANDAGYSFEYLTGCDMFHLPIWEKVIDPMNLWDFAKTYRLIVEK